MVTSWKAIECMSNKIEASPRPSILAPAGNKASFLAALAAGADAVYCGLKQFSARMEAKNILLEELVPLTRLAHDMGTKVYVALNSLLKADDLNMAGRILELLNRWVKPDALIIPFCGDLFRIDKQPVVHSDQRTQLAIPNRETI